jgi:hypothetical protein
MREEDFCTQEQAERQAESIRRYWRERNVEITVWVEALPTSRRNVIYSVRSDLQLCVGDLGGGRV